VPLGYRHWPFGCTGPEEVPGSTSWWLAHFGRLDDSVSQGGHEPVLLDARAWFVKAGQAGCQAGVIIGDGRPAAIGRIRRWLGAWRAAATWPRVALARRSVARPAQRYACGRYERDQREGDSAALPDRTLPKAPLTNK
jgi:hypothetical protein